MYKKVTSAIFALFLMNCSIAAAQWQVPSGNIPIGRGPGVVGFSSSTPSGLVPTILNAFCSSHILGTAIYYSGTAWVCVNTGYVMPEHFGGTCGVYGTAVGSLPDATIPINNMIAAIKVNGGGIAHFGPCTYKTTTGISADFQGVTIEGSGERTTTLVYAPTSTGSAIAISRNTLQTFYTGIRNISIGSGDVTVQKNAINLVDVSRFTLESVTCSFYPQDGTLWRGGNTHDSTCLRINGRDTSLIKNFTAYGEIPLVIAANPNSTVTLDSTVFEDCNFVGHLDTSTTNPLILVSNPDVITNIKFTGAQNWQGGTDGFKLITASAAFTSQGFYFSGIKSEQSPDAVAGVSGYTFNIQSNQRIASFNVRDSQGGDRNFAKLRGVVGPEFSNIVVDAVLPNAEAINVDSTAGTLAITNSTFFTTVTASITGLNILSADPVPTGLFLSTAIPPTARYSTSVSPVRFQQNQTISRAFATIGTCIAGLEGTVASVNDSNTVVWGANVAGGGANKILAYCDGTNWTVAGK